MRRDVEARGEIVAAVRGKLDQELLGAAFAKPRGATTAGIGGSRRRHGDQLARHLVQARGQGQRHADDEPCDQRKPGAARQRAPGLDDYANSLTALIAEETGSPDGDLRPRAVAKALLGIHRALIAYARERALAGVPASWIARELRTQAKRAFDQLEQGLGDYGMRR